MTAQAILISNPKSHAVAVRGSVLAAIADKDSNLVHIEIDQINQLPNQIRKVLRSSEDTLFVEGGDGTVDAVITAALLATQVDHVLPKFAILPGGSTNLAYKIFGLKSATPTAVEKAVDRAMSSGQTIDVKRHRAMLIATSDTEDPLVGFLLSTGSVARAMIYTQENLHDDRRGILSVGKALLQFGLSPEKAMHSDGEPVIRASKFVQHGRDAGGNNAVHAFSLLSTFERLSLRLQPFWNRGDHSIGFTRANWPIKNLRRGVMKLAAGRPGETLERHGLESYGCEAMSFECDGPVVLDGELLPIPSDQMFHITTSPDLEFVQ